MGGSRRLAIVPLLPSPQRAPLVHERSAALCRLCLFAKWENPLRKISGNPDRQARHDRLTIELPLNQPVAVFGQKRAEQLRSARFLS